MYTKQILLPMIPRDVITEVYKSIDEGQNQAFDGDNAQYALDYYAWISGNNALQKWCKENISPDIHWGIQVITKDMPMHKDLGTESKFNYIVDPGGDAVITNYYDDNGKLLESIHCIPNVWYILNVKINHDVKNISNGHKRISITGRIHP